MSGKIMTDANLMTPSYCTSASPEHGAVSSKNVGLLLFFFVPLKLCTHFILTLIQLFHLPTTSARCWI